MKKMTVKKSSSLSPMMFSNTLSRIVDENWSINEGLVRSPHLYIEDTLAFSSEPVYPPLEIDELIARVKR